MADERRHTKDKTDETQYEKHTQAQKIIDARRQSSNEIREGSDGREKEETGEEIKRDEANLNKNIIRQDKARGGKRKL